MARIAAGTRLVRRASGGVSVVTTEGYRAEHVPRVRPRLGSVTVRRLWAPGGPGRWLAPLALALVVAGCGAGPGAGPQRPDAPSPAPSSAAPSPVVPADGLALRAFGYTSGPLDAFSLPRGAVLVTSVDQPDNVTAVL